MSEFNGSWLPAVSVGLPVHDGADHVAEAPIALAQKALCYGAILYRLVAPQTWIKQFMPGRYTET